MGKAVALRQGTKKYSFDVVVSCLGAWTGSNLSPSRSRVRGERWELKSSVPTEFLLVRSFVLSSFPKNLGTK